ncbi:hypothetical protein EJ02DRAFT_217794 [Clathrospora elynae]|uniref:Uncharacterized protein n=1 Tax=Clathrospora elynae TaxID=706981 RepID=A0A6A5TCR9_9PLEO|nr:hypothetical protein EJ02DRAFT_217794 [Clathrospora elynae]
MPRWFVTSNLDRVSCRTRTNARLYPYRGMSHVDDSASQHLKPEEALRRPIPGLLIGRKRMRGLYRIILCDYRDRSLPWRAIVVGIGLELEIQWLSICTLAVSAPCILVQPCFNTKYTQPPDAASRCRLPFVDMQSQRRVASSVERPLESVRTSSTVLEASTQFRSPKRPTKLNSIQIKGISRNVNGYSRPAVLLGYFRKAP